MKKPLIIAASLTILAAAGWFGATAYANSIARQQIDKELLEARDTADIRYDDVDVNLMTKSVSIKDVSIAPPQGGEPILVEEVVVNEFDQDSAVPAFLSARIIGAEINVDALGEIGAGIRQLGYPQIVKISSDVSYRYDDLARELELRDLSLEAADVGTLEARFKIGNFQLGSGEEALHKARTLRPQLITLDLNLPEKDGWDTLTELKADDDTTDIPVVVITVLTDHGRAFSLGADEYLVKPVDGGKLVEALAHVLDTDGGPQLPAD